MLFNSYLRTVQPPPIVEYLDKCQGLINDKSKVINLCQGTAYFKPPQEALVRIKWSDVHGYSSDQGLLELREKITSKLFPDLPASNVLVTPGANNAFFNLMVTILTPGLMDEVLLPSPVYFNHAMAIDMLGGKTIEVSCNQDFSLDLEAFECSITDKTRAIVITTPNNPTGQVYTREQLEKVAELCLDNNILLVADETYANFVEFIYSNKKHHSPFSIATDMGVNAVSISSFSKTFGIPGWRLGYLVTSGNFTDLIPEIMKVQDTSPICAPVPAQHLACELIDNWLDYFQEKISRIEERKKTIEHYLKDHLDYTPKGAFYCFPRFNGDSYQQALELTAKTGVMVLPGSIFGDTGENHFRVAYGHVSLEQLETAGKYIKIFLEKY
ncbi:MAG: pyridoxal phosphate-dependent aminotransferase [Candidatus Hodarchaeales archaeon]